MRRERPRGWRKRQEPAPALTAAERELVTAPCPHHSSAAVCDQCPERYSTDGFGFPHPQIAKQRGRYRLCKTCGKLKSIAEWDREAWGRCLNCAPNGAP